jgi:CRISPR-associated protein Csd1
MRAVLSGSDYPRTLLASVIRRIRADHDINARRAAIIAAVLRRNFKEKIPMSLDRSNPDPAYRLGRLFAAYAYAEHSYAKRSATLRDKYLAGASANPAGIFPLLMRGYENNRSALLKQQDEKRAYGIKAEKEVAQILDLMDGALGFPKSLNLEEQGKFFIGFYHQWNAFFTTPETAAEAAANPDDTSPAEQEGANQ